MRLPYAPKEASASDSHAQAIHSRVEARRSPRPLQALDLTLLHSPNVADGWNSFLGAIRTKTSLADDIREIAICRVAALNGAHYEWHHHAPLAEKAGVDNVGMKALERTTKYTTQDRGEALSDKQWAVVRYTDAMTKDISVGEEIFEGLRKQFQDQEIVEITATVSCQADIDSSLTQ